MLISPVSSVTQNYRNVTSPNTNTRVNQKSDGAAVTANNSEVDKAGSSQGKQITTDSDTTSQTEKNQLVELKARDTEVRAHERAHLAAAGRYATSGATFTYQRGPDGNNYAVSGEVSIDSSPVLNDPQATLEKALTIQKAALAPSQPSAQDRAVAANAMQMATEARIQILSKSTSDTDSKTNASNDNNSATGVNEYENIATYNEDLPTSILFGIA